MGDNSIFSGENPGVPLPGVPENGPGSGNNGGTDIAKLLQMVLSKNPTSPNQTGGGSMITKAPTAPGAGVPMPGKHYADTMVMPDTHNRNTQFGVMMQNLGQVVQAADKNHQDQQARTLAVDMERLMIALQDPNDPNNINVINDIMADRKKRKAIGKALDISFLGGEDKLDPISKQARDIVSKKVQSNNSDPNAQQTAKGKLSPMAEELMSKLPRSTQLSPEYLAKAQAVKDKLIPDANTQATQETAQQKMLVATILNAQNNQQKDTDSVRKALTEIAKIYGKQAAAEALSSTQLKIAQVHLQGELARANAIIKSAEVRANAVLKKGVGSGGAAKDKINALKVRLTADQNAMKQLMNNKPKWWQSSNDWNKAVQALGHDIEDARNQAITLAGEDLSDAGIDDTSNNDGDNFDPAKLDKSVGGEEGDGFLQGIYKDLFNDNESGDEKDPADHTGPI